MTRWWNEKLPNFPQYCPKNRQISFSWKYLKFVTKKFKKSPNLVTLVQIEEQTVLWLDVIALSRRTTFEHLAKTFPLISYHLVLLPWVEPSFLIPTKLFSTRLLTQKSSSCYRIILFCYFFNNGPILAPICLFLFFWTTILQKNCRL